MAGSNINNVLTQQMRRVFIQNGGAGPNNPLLLAGKDYGYSRISGRNRQIRGGVSNIPVRSPDGQGFVNTGSMETAPGFDTFELGIRETITGIPLAATFQNCPLGVYEVVGNICNSLSDHLTGYSGAYVDIYADSIITQGVNQGDGAAYTDDNISEDVIGMTSRGGNFKHGQLFMSPLATASTADLATTLTTDVTYGNQQLCQICGRADDGTGLKYWSAASTTASPGAKPGIFYQIGSATPVYASVTAAAASENLTGIAVVGSYLLVISSTAGGAGIGGYYYAQIGASGVPGTWTKVVTGFQSNKEPTDILVLSSSEIYFSANGGYIYKCTDLTAGVTVINAGATTTNNLLRIQGNRNLIVAVGATGSIIYSANSGRSWATTTSTPAASNPTWQAVDVIGAKGIWVGSATGRLFYTLDGGVTWTEKTFDQSSTGAITDVYFVNAHEGYFVHTVSSVGRIFRTFTGGQSWWNSSPAIEGLGTFTSLGRIAAPTVGNETLKSNNVILSGTVTGAQGLLLSGSGQVF
jgi:photosystem II stability/assembly factor-like uncharacterized protein